MVTDNHSYNEAIGTIKMLCPDEVKTRFRCSFFSTISEISLPFASVLKILLHDGTKSGVLARKIELECRCDARILYISRQVPLLSYWS